MDTTTYEEQYEDLSILDFIKHNFVQIFLFILVFIIIYVIDHVTNLNAMLFATPNALPGAPQFNPMPSMQIKKSKKKR